MSACDHPLDGHVSHGPWCETPGPVTDAVPAAAKALHADRCVSESCRESGHAADELLASVHQTGIQSADLHISRVALEAAAPHLTAAERERCAKRAEQEALEGQKTGIDRIILRAFAARLREESP